MAVWISSYDRLDGMYSHRIGSESLICSKLDPSIQEEWTICRYNITSLYPVDYLFNMVGDSD